MSKGQKKGNREVRKPKKAKKPVEEITSTGKLTRGSTTPVVFGKKPR